MLMPTDSKPSLRLKAKLFIIDATKIAVKAGRHHGSHRIT